MKLLTRKALFAIALLSFSLPLAQAAAIKQTVTTHAAGNVSLTCEDPGLWHFDMTVESSDDVEVITVTLNADTPQQPPRFSVAMEMPQVDTQHIWSPTNLDRFQLRPNWGGFFSSELALSMPLYSLFNDNNQNRLTIASSEPLRRVDVNLGLREEGCVIIGSLSYFNVPEAPISRYQTKIKLDSRPIFWADALRQGTQWITDEAGITPIEAPAGAFDPLYSTWYQFHQNVSDKAIEDECRKAAELGMKTLIVDDGWQTDDNNRGYAYCGDWEVSRNRFPDMAAHVKRVQDMGIKYMMWYSVPFVGIHSRAYQHFKGKFLSEHDNIGELDPRFPEVREYLCSTYEKALREWNLDGFKLDFIDGFRVTDDPAVAENYAGRDIKSVPEAVDVLMTEIYRRLSAIKPDILIEFRQAYIGPSIRRYGNMLRVGDCPGDHHANRRGIANLLLTSGNSAVHADMLEWNVADTPETAARNILSSLFGVIQYSMMLNELPQDHLKVIKHWLDFSQLHRATLLESDFRPYHPEACYPVIEAESNDEKIVAVYDDMTVPTITGDSKPVYLINATGAKSVVTELESKPKSIEAFNVYGELVGIDKPAKGLNRISIPKSGYAILRY